MFEMAGNPSSVQKEALQRPLRDELFRQFCMFGQPGWKIPALELTAKRDPIRRNVTMTARVFNLNGDQEIKGVPEPLIDAAFAYHKLCSSWGEGWTRCQLTLTLGEGGTVKRSQWDYKYD
jgi:hypothetical protein